MAPRMPISLASGFETPPWASSTRKAATFATIRALVAHPALPSGTAEVEDAETLRRDHDGAVLAGERKCVRIPGFDLGNSPSEFVEPRGDELVLTTTNGTRAILAAAERCERVVTAAHVNLDAVAR